MWLSYQHQEQCTYDITLSVTQKIIKTPNHRFSNFMTLLKVVDIADQLNDYCSNRARSLRWIIVLKSSLRFNKNSRVC